MADSRLLGLGLRVTGWPLRWQLLCVAGLGALAALGQAPVGVWPATILSLAAFFTIVMATGAGRRAFWLGVHFGVGYFGTALSWIIAPFMVDAAATGWMAPFALVLMAYGGGLFWGVAVWRTVVSLPLLIGGFAAVEMLRSLILTGFPWALIGHIWIDTPVAQLAAWGGPHLLGLISLVTAGALIALLRRQWWAVAMPIGLSLAWVVLPPPPSPPAADAPVVRLVQPNARQDEKWDPEKRQVFFERMLDFTRSGDRPDVIVWPESAVPQLLNYAQISLDAMAEAASGVPIVAGINRADGDAYHNSFAVLDGQGFVSALYDKAHLVPFGEYIPASDVLKRFGLMPLNEVAGFTAGQGDGLVDLPGIGQARALICYEAIFAEEIAATARPRLLVLITNDAWFGDNFGPRQHLAQARLRAIEQGLPMVRVANTGISAMIDGYGRITGSLALNTAGFVDLPLPPALPPTQYTRTGDGPMVLIVLALLLGGATYARRVYD